jgi:hypothetical protein
MEKPHKKLDLWQAAMKSATVIYKLTNKFPEEEKFRTRVPNEMCIDKHPVQYR